MSDAILLLRRPAPVEPGEFNTRILDELGAELTARADVSALSAFVVDEESAPLAEAMGRKPGFDAVLQIECRVELPGAEIVAAGEAFGVVDLYAVEQRRVKSYRRSWPDGERTPGVVMMSPVYRAATVTHDGFDTHWRDTHGPLACRHHVGMWDYRQNPVLETLTKQSPTYDGVAILGFPTVAAFTDGLFDSAEGTRIIMDDTGKFLALDRSVSTMMGEYVLKS